jgi:HK97 family phage prohead protease
MDKLELRAFDFELRSAADRRLTGHAVVWGAASLDMGFREQFHAGAFAESLADGHDVVLLWHHDTSKPLASRNAGTLDLTEDTKGLAFDAHLNATSWAVDALEAVRSKTVRKMSFGFLVPKGGDEWSQRDGQLFRIVKRADLVELSPTAFPAYPQTDVAARFLTPIEILSSRGMADASRRRDLLKRSLEIQRERTY